MRKFKIELTAEEVITALAALTTVQSYLDADNPMKEKVNNVFANIEAQHNAQKSTEEEGTDNFEKVLAISTGNISERTKDALESGIPHVRSESHEYGFIIFVTSYFQDDTEDEVIAAKEEYPDLAAILKIANDNGCSLVNIDADGEFYPGLEIFEL